MKPELPDLKRALVRLPQQFDSGRLQREVACLPEADWIDHPEGFPGVRVLPLVSVGGGENSDLAISGPLRETYALTKSPYLREALAAFEAQVSRAHLLWLGPNAAMPSRRASGYYWYRRVRIHAPVLANPAVLFECGGAAAHMRAGESWSFDHWQKHSLTNVSDSPCIHLVVDLKALTEEPLTGDHLAPYIEPYCFEVLTPAEFANLAGAVREGSPVEAQKKVDAALTAALASWRDIYLRSGNNAQAEAEYYLVIDRLRRELTGVEFAPDAQRDFEIILSILCTNEGVARQGKRRLVSNQPVVPWNAEARYRTSGGKASIPSPRIAAIAEAFHEPRTVIEAHEISSRAGTREQFAAVVRDLHRIGLLEPDFSDTVLRQPVFIVSAPRSGSTMLFDALRKSDDLWTIGHESHALIEQSTGLHPEQREWSSNRLLAADSNPKLKSLLTHRYARELRNAQGRYAPSVTIAERRTGFRLLDKTPKNALRIPFFV